MYAYVGITSLQMVVTAWHAARVRDDSQDIHVVKLMTSSSEPFYRLTFQQPENHTAYVPKLEKTRRRHLYPVAKRPVPFL
jgi:hypothetical protein